MGQGHLHSLKDLATPLKGQVGNQFHQPIFKDYHFLPLILLSFFPNFHMPHISFSSTLLSYAPIFLFYSLHSETSLSFLSFFIPNLTPWFQNPKMIYKPKKTKCFFLLYSECLNSPPPIHGMTPSPNCSLESFPRCQTHDSTAVNRFQYTPVIKLFESNCKVILVIVYINLTVPAIISILEWLAELAMPSHFPKSQKNSDSRCLSLPLSRRFSCSNPST